MIKSKLFFIITLIAISLCSTNVFAQENGENPIYIVQPGENLSTIAYKFNISVQDLISINNIADSNLISAGTELIIPGLEGISGTLSISPLEFGENVPLILKKYHLSIENFLKLNKLTSPSEAFVGTYLIIPIENTANPQNNSNFIITGSNNSIISESVKNGINPWTAFISNKNVRLSFQIPGDTFFIISENEITDTSRFSPYINKIEISPLPLVQGHTTVIKVFTSESANISGMIDDKPLRFYENDSGDMMYALSGIHALKEPGLVDITLSGQFNNGESFKSNQFVLLESGGYVQEELTVESTLIDEQLNVEESAIIQDILSNISDIKLWKSNFRFPVDGSMGDDTIGFSSYFGNRRSYNNGEYFGFHGGLDFRVVLNTLNIYAPSPGTVIYAGPMNIRGYTTFIDHGQGVFSGYGHQSEILVEVGRQVNTGDLIGLIGKTGRVTGPHLHWDIWVNGNQVDPFDWIFNKYP